MRRWENETNIIYGNSGLRCYTLNIQDAKISSADPNYFNMIWQAIAERHSIFLIHSKNYELPVYVLKDCLFLDLKNYK